jgi:glutathione S-transferase
LENQPMFLHFLSAAGPRFPISTTVAGTVYLIGRLVYFRGYCTGNPNGRHRGGFMYLGTLALVGMVGRFAWELMTYKA